MYKYFLIVINILIFQSNSFGALKCSSNGTDIIYVNGVFVKDVKDVIKSADTIKDRIVKITNVDSSTKGIGDFVGYVHNISLDGFADIKELENQASRNYTGESRAVFFQKMLQEKVLKTEKATSSKEDYARFEKLTNEALDLIHPINSGGSLPSQEEINAKGSLLARIKAEIRSISFAAEEILNMAQADKATTDLVKNKIVTAIKANKKVIFVSHSQGNEVLRTAVNELKIERLAAFGNENDYSKFENVFGSLQIAVPSAELVTPLRSGLPKRSEYVTLNRDLVILGAGSFLMNPKYPPLNPNYEFVSFKKEGFWEKLFDFIPVVNVLVDEYQSLAYHGMDDTYLSPNIKARKIGSVTEGQAMSEIFNDSIVRVAESLEDNCLKFAINPTTTDNKTFTFTAYVLSGNAPTAYEWNFGDGSVVTTTENVVTHTFNSTTNKVFTVTAKGLDGSSTPSIATTIASVIIPEVYHYELWVLCQTSPKNLCYYEYSCTPEQRADETLVYTGLNYPSVYIFDHNNVVVGVQREPEVSAPFVDSIYDRNDPTKQRRIEFTIGNSCPQGREISEQAREFFVESLQ